MKRAFVDGLGHGLDHYLDHHLHFAAQPIVDPFTREVMGLEMLARNAAGQCPVALLGAAARMRWSAAMLDEAIIERALHAVRQAGVRPVKIGINASRHGIASGACFHALKHHAFGFQPQQIVVEVSESDPLQTDERALRHALKDLRSHGFRVSLDDTGSGSTGLRQMFVLPYDSIKLDISVTRALPKVLQRSDIGLREIIKALRHRGVSVVAEGVEKPEELQALMFVGCDLAQGYLLGRPAPLPLMLAATEAAATPVARPVATPQAAPPATGLPPRPPGEAASTARAGEVCLATSTRA